MIAAIRARVWIRAPHDIAALGDFAHSVRIKGSQRRATSPPITNLTAQVRIKAFERPPGPNTQCAQLFGALSNRLDAVEKAAFGPNYNQQPSTPPLNRRVRAPRIAIQHHGRPKALAFIARLGWRAAWGQRCNNENMVRLALGTDVTRGTIGEMQIDRGRIG